MAFWFKLLILIAACLVGILMARYREWLVGAFGRNEYAERFLGSGGSYTMWWLLGVILIVGTLIYLFH